MSPLGVLISNLAVPERKAPMKSLNDLININGKFKIFTHVGGNTQSVILNWANESKANYEAYNSRVIHDSDPFSEPKNVDLSGSSAYLYEKEVFKNHLLKAKIDGCQFASIELDNFPATPNGWMYPKNSILRPLFDQYFDELSEKGILDRILKTYQVPNQNCEDEGFMPVDFCFVSFLFILLSLGACLALIFFSIEMCKIDLSWT